MRLARVGVSSVRSPVTRVIELDGGNDARVRPNDEKVDREPADPIQNALVARTSPEPYRLEQLHLWANAAVRETRDAACHPGRF
jgi:hypothetical protein